jgi:integrase
MPRKLSNVLTPLAVKNAKPGRHADGGGLHLLVKDSGSRSWVFRFMLKGKTRDIGLGPAAGQDAVSLASARDLAAELRLGVKRGTDPLLERHQKALEAEAAVQAAKIAGVTFRAVAEAYIASNEASWRNPKHTQQWCNTLSRYVYPVIGELPVAQIRTPHVLQILEPIWLAKPTTASRIRGRIEMILDAAKARGYREGENPARWRGHIALILPARSRLASGHHKAMPYDAIPGFVAQLRARQAMAARALEFIILTAARTGEALGATWDEFDLKKGIWTIPAARMKANREHRVPLPARAVEILEETKPLGKNAVFPGERAENLTSKSMGLLLRRMEIDATVHGFRSGFRDWSAECTAYAHEVCEMALAHVIGNKAEAAYRRGDLFEKRRRLMEDWATFCDGRSVGATITPIRAML